MNFKKSYIYILESLSDNSYYVGSCKDIGVRLRSHNNGLVKSTKGHMPWQLVDWERFDNLGKARKRESQIKSWKSRVAITALIKNRKIQSIEDPR